MINKKVKTIFPVSANQVKPHLRIYPDVFEDDSYLENYTIKAATRFCENYISKDIAFTFNTLDIYDFSDSAVRIEEANLITLSNIISDSSSLITSYSYIPSADYFDVEFTGTVTSNPLRIEFTSGYNQGECPEDIIQAILMKCGDLYESERTSYNFGTYRKSDAIESLLMPYRKIRFYA